MIELAAVVAFFFIGSSRRAHIAVGIILGVFLAYPVASALTARLHVSQTQLLTVLLLALGSAVAGQLLSPNVSQRDSRARYFVALPIFAVSLLMWVHAAPAIAPERVTGRSLWLAAALACLMALASPRVSTRAMALALVAVAGSWIALSPPGELEANAIWGGRAVMMAGLATAATSRRPLAGHLALTGCLVVLVFLGKQGPLAGLFFGWAWFAVQRMPSRVRAFFLTLAAAALVLAQTVIDLGSLVATSVDEAGTGTIRLQLYGQALDQFLQEPLVGHGFGGYLGSIGGRDYVYPHNIAVEALAEYGIASIALLAVAVLGQWRALNPPLIPLYLGALTAAMFSGSLELNHEFWMVAAAGAVGIGVGAHQPSDRSKAGSRAGPGAQLRGRHD